MFDSAVALLEAGTAAGLHTGWQLAVWWRGEPRAALAAGTARPGVAMTPGTLLPWFSCTKVVTAVAVAQQVERGRLGWDDKVADHIAQFAAGGKQDVTIRHLLTHTAGFRHADGDLAAVCAAPLEPGWQPGQRAGYHLRGSFLVLGELVLRATGQPFANYVHEAIFEPLDMADSWLAMDEHRMSTYGDRIGLMPDTGKGTEPPAGPTRISHPAFSGTGPATDLVRLLEALRRGGVLDGERVLEPATVALMTSRHRKGMRDETFGAVMDWGLGLMRNSWHYTSRPPPYGYGDRASPAAFGHGGAEASIAFADPDYELAVVLVCNGRPGEAANHRRTQPVLTALYDDLATTADRYI